MSYTRYTVEDADGSEQSVMFEESEYAEARDYALAIKGEVIGNEYEWTGSEIVDDFTDDPGNDDDDRAEDDDGD